MFLSAMRHFREELVERDIRVLYRQLDDADNRGDLPEEIRWAVHDHLPERLVLVKPWSHVRCERRASAATRSCGFYRPKRCRMA